MNVDTALSGRKFFGQKVGILAIAAAVAGSMMLSAGLVSAEEAEKVEKKVLKPGVVASFGSHRGSADVDAAGLPEAAGAEEAPPISASVSKAGSGKCTARIKNPSETASYSVRYAVEGHRDGKRVSSSRHSARLSPGQEVTRTIKCNEGVNMSLRVLGGKEL